MRLKQKNIFLLQIYLFLLLSIDCIAQRRGFFKDPNFIIAPSTPIILEKELKVFNRSNTDAVYMITIGVDVPNNRKPMKVAYQFEPGHVFIILQKITATDTIHKVFGFYPVKVTKALFKKNIESQIKDNSKREYDVGLIKTLTKDQFQKVLNQALQYAKEKYHLNKFNCYDYVLRIFNTVAENDTLPCIYIRYPIFFGKGGSLCSFYKYMKQQRDSGQVWASYINFGNFVAPVSTPYNQIISDATYKD